MEISPYFRDLFLRTTLVFPLDYFLYVTYVIIVIMIIIIIIIIIALLCDKLAKIFFLASQLSFANLLCSQILMNAIVMFVMLMLTVSTLMVLIIASVSKDASEMDSLANVD